MLPKKFTFWGTLLLAAAAPLAFGIKGGPLGLNQFEIQKNGALRGDLILARQYLWSTYTLGLSRLSGRRKPISQTAPSDPVDIFSAIFSRLPGTAYVYPTETYYYFTLPWGERELKGNLRFTAIDSGKLLFTFYDPLDAEFEGSLELGAAEGLRLEPKGSAAYDLTYDARTVRFYLNRGYRTPPADFILADGEEFVAAVFDESGYSFVLVYNSATRAFQYFLNPSSIPPERFRFISKDPRLLSGQGSEFVFFKTASGRLLLFGVYAEHIKANSPFDGPFDQLPPDLEIRERLHAAYPYSALAGGIDQHGNFLLFADQRVSISPYLPYDSRSELEVRLGKCEPVRSIEAEFLACLSYEWKRDFHKAAAARWKQSGHLQTTSQGWPANHSGAKSMNWPAGHETSRSRAWPADHTNDLSSSRVSVRSDRRYEMPPFYTQGWPANHHGEASSLWPHSHLRKNSLVWPSGHEAERSYLGG